MAYFDSMKEHKKANPKSIATGSHDVVRSSHSKALEKALGKMVGKGNVLKGKNIEGKKK
jgi:hypothetical protein